MMRDIGEDGTGNRLLVKRTMRAVSNSGLAVAAVHERAEAYRSVCSGHPGLGVLVSAEVWINEYGHPIVNLLLPYYELGNVKTFLEAAEPTAEARVAYADDMWGPSVRAALGFLHGHGLTHGDVDATHVLLTGAAVSPDARLGLPELREPVATPEADLRALDRLVAVIKGEVDLDSTEALVDALAEIDRLRAEAEAEAERDSISREHDAALQRNRQLRLAARAETRRFLGSAYQRVYDRTPANPHAEYGRKGIRKRLLVLERVHDAESFMRATGAENVNRKTIVQAAVNLWTKHDHAGQNGLFKDLNKVLMEVDDEDELERWMWFVRLANHWICRPSNALKADLAVWRGSQMTKEQGERLFAGLVVRPPMFVATTTDRTIAVGFCTNAQYLVHLAIPSGSRNACSVSEHSDYAGEREFLLPPFTAVRIDEVDHGGPGRLARIRGTVLDNLVHEELEATLGEHAPAWPL